ncbi:MAG: hypothetical protein VKJ64_02640 [Leptolyngbyaceae bacterium]|nr:hypothetical protein [Leptolyngbyaceae bacterium]
MGILKKFLGEPGFAVEAEPADEAVTMETSVVEPTSAPEASAADEAEGDGAVSAEAEAPKKPAAPKRKATVKTKVSSSSAPVVATDPIQALVDAAIAQASVKNGAGEATPVQTFATDYLVIPSMGGRRRPGPSLSPFMDISTTMGNR